MNPLKITARNYRSFPELDLDLPQGCIAVLGANGAGKSSIVNAIDLIIFGAQSRSLADTLSDTTPDDDLLLELELEHAGTLYRIRRTFSPRGRGKTTLDFEYLTLGGEAPDRETGIVHDHCVDTWNPLTRASAKETQELIEATLGLSRETFRASAFLAQGDGAAFTEAQPRDRKRILAEVLGLDRYDTLLQLARGEKQTVDRELQQLAGRAAETLAAAAEAPALQRALGATADAEAAATERVTVLERTHADTGAEYQAAREHAARRAAAQAELREATAALTALEQRIARGAQAAEQLSIARDELAALTTKAQLDDLLARDAELVERDQTYRDAVAAREIAASEAEAAKAWRDDLLGRAKTKNETAADLRAKADHVLMHVGEATCDRCAQTLGREAADRAAASFRSEAAALEGDATDLEREAKLVQVPVIPDEPVQPLVDTDTTVADALVVTRSRIVVARNDQAQRARLEERVTACETTLEEQPDDDTVARARTAAAERQRAADLIGEPPNLDAITRRGTQITEQLRLAREALEAHKAERVRVEERLRVARAAGEAAVEIEKNSKSLRADLDVLAQLERAFSPNGIPALIIENSAIPYIETEATRILAALGTSYQVELRTQAALKSGEGLRDTLDVIVLGDHGERPYETFSGGERTRINLALRIALARLLAHRCGAESRLLVIDEPEFLDEQGTAALVEVLRDLEGDFDRLYLISHVPALRDAFDQVLTVVKDESGSRVTDGYEAVLVEAVAA